MDSFEERYDAGIQGYTVMMSVDDFVEQVVWHRTVELVSKELTKLREGLKLHEVVSILKRYESDAMTELSFDGKVTAKHMKKLFLAHFSEDM